MKKTVAMSFSSKRPNRQGYYVVNEDYFEFGPKIVYLYKDGKKWDIICDDKVDITKLYWGNRISSKD